MDYEEELEKMQNEALAELDGGSDDTDGDDTGHEDEYSDSTDNDGEDENDGENTEGDEDQNVDEDDDPRFDLDDDEDEDDDEDDADTDDTSDNENSNSSNDSKTFEPVEVEIDGQTITLETQEELMAYVKNKGTSSPKRHRKSKTEQIVEQGKVSDDELKLFIDAKNGDPSAIAKIAKDSGIDIYDLDDDQAERYQAKFQETILTEVDEVAQDIMEDKDLHSNFTNIAKTVPDEFKAVLATDAKALKNFARHIKTGLAQEVIPMVIKEQALKGGEFLDIYARIGREVSGAKKAPEKSKVKRKVNPRAEELKKRAKNTKGANKGTKTKMTGDDIWDMPDKEWKEKFGG